MSKAVIEKLLKLGRLVIYGQSTQSQAPVAVLPRSRVGEDDDPFLSRARIELAEHAETGARPQK